jgi:hypothetical protein
VLVVGPLTESALLLEAQAPSARAAQEQLQPMEEEEEVAIQQVAMGLLEPALMLQAIQLVVVGSMVKVVTHFLPP